jgi:LmbE family N-acetylglucosaminyl deacetylase
MGGTVLKIKDEDSSHRICVVMVCKGDVPNRVNNDHEKRWKTFNKNMSDMGIEHIYNLDMPSNRLEVVNKNNIINDLDNIIDDTQPDTIYTHNRYDINQDHRIVSEAVRVVARPRVSCPVTSLLEFPITGSTEWNGEAFLPNTVYDVSKYHTDKLKYFRRYDTEIRPSPDPMSVDKIKARDSYYGSIYGMKYAEVFKLIFKKL